MCAILDCLLQEPHGCNTYSQLMCFARHVSLSTTPRPTSFEVIILYKLKLDQFSKLMHISLLFQYQGYTFMNESLIDKINIGHRSIWSDAGRECRRPCPGRECRRPCPGRECRRPCPGRECRRPCPGRE